jgi:hypothetical protein
MQIKNNLIPDKINKYIGEKRVGIWEKMPLPRGWQRIQKTTGNGRVAAFMRILNIGLS